VHVDGALWAETHAPRIISILRGLFNLLIHLLVQTLINFKSIKIPACHEAFLLGFSVFCGVNSEMGLAQLADALGVEATF